MSIQPLLIAFEKLVEIHADLLAVSKQKTVIVKLGQTQELQSLLTKEKRYIQDLQRAETVRQQAVEKWLTDQQKPIEPVTVTQILENVTDVKDKDQLAESATRLTNIMTALKQQEVLNQTLVEQSLKFVNISLDMLRPSIQQFNYGNQGHQDEKVKQSVFDSKA